VRCLQTANRCRANGTLARARSPVASGYSMLRGLPQRRDAVADARFRRRV
jgi:hypothetical protein